MTDLVVPEPTKQTPESRFFKRYEDDVDEFGFHPAKYRNVERFTHFLYKSWFQVQVAGLENIPAKGNAVLFGNHSGGLPLDGFLLYDGIINYHPEPRRLRFLVSKFLLKNPAVGDILRSFGCTPADYEVSTKLLKKEELVFFYPEAEKGTGKLYKNRYKLEEFHSGFVRAAIATSSPLIPVVTIGGDEIYPILVNCKPVAKLLKWPYYPVTPFFPWLPFPFGSIPLPIKIMVAVWPSFKLKYAPEESENANLMTAITNDIRNDLQSKVTDLLDMRVSPFAKWDMNEVNAYMKQAKTYWPRSEKHFQQP
ncbi:MAG: lysophospholipid acyltransferase family protein [Candidatus Obscuribacterales bacterium]